MFLGGGLVSALTLVLSRENALRAPYLFGVVLGLLLWALAAPRLTTAKIEAARSAGENHPLARPLDLFYYEHRYKSHAQASHRPVALIRPIRADSLHQKRLWGRSTLHRRFYLSLEEDL